MKKRYTITVMVSTAALIAACGGGGSTSTTTPVSQPSFSLKGTVPGTLIEAFCEDGSYHAVNSESNGTNKHPFVLELPTNLSCRLVMTTNEDDPDNKVITPIKLVNSSGAGSIAFSGKEDMDLDHIDLALNRAEMNSDENEDGVEDVPKEVILDSTVSSSVEVIISDNDPMDKDDDDIIDIYEDDDGDKINNHDDDDDDDDGIKDTDDDDYKDDHDGDGVSDDKDEDDDNDGIKDEDEEDNQTGGGSTTLPVIVTTPSAGRLLASQCAQCHRTDGNPNKGFEDLIGEEIYGDLVEMKRESKRELMHLQANGYSEEQIRLMDDYFNNLSVNNGGE